MAVLLWVLAAKMAQKHRSLGGLGDAADARVERSRAIAPGHLRQRDHLDPCGVARGAELFETLAAEVAHRIHRRFEEFARIEFALPFVGALAERRGHRPPAIGVDIDRAPPLPHSPSEFLHPPA